MKKKLLCMLLITAISANGVNYNTIYVNADDNAEKIEDLNNMEALKNALLGKPEFNIENEEVKALCMDSDIAANIKKASLDGEKVITLENYMGKIDVDSESYKSISDAYSNGILMLAPASVTSDYVITASKVKSGEILDNILTNELNIKSDVLVESELEDEESYLKELKDLCDVKFESVSKENTELSIEELLTYVTASLLNTSKPLMDGDDLYSVREQGAGAVDKEAFADRKVIATVNGAAKVELGEVSTKADDTLLEIELKNYDDKDVKFDLNDCQLYVEDEQSNDDKVKKLEDGKISFFKNEVIVPANGSEKVVVLVSTPDVEERFVEGYIKLSGEYDISIPVTMYKGTLSNRKLVDENKSYFMDKYGNRLGLYTKKTGSGYEDYYTNDYISFSPVGVYGYINPVLSSSRNIEDVNVSVEGKKLNNFLGKIDMLGDVLPVKFNGNYYDENKGDYFDYPDGDYDFVINSRSDINDDYEKNAFRVVVDSIAPEVNIENEGSNLTITIKENNMMHPYFTICMDGKIKKVNLVSDCNYVNGKYYYKLNGDKNNIECLFMDMAGNLDYEIIKDEESSLVLCDDEIDLSLYDLSKTNIEGINLNSYDTLSDKDIEDGKYLIKGRIIGKLPDEFKVGNKNIEVIETDKENIYEFSVYVDVKRGFNSYDFSVKNKDYVDAFEIKNVIYNDKINMSIKKDIANAAGVIRISQKKYTYEVTVDSQIGIYNVYINNELAYVNKSINDSSEKKLSFEYNFSEATTKYINVKVVDVCGNVYEDDFKIAYVKVTKRAKKVVSLIQADIYYEKIQTYTGKPICPSVDVVCKGLNLSEGEDYNIKYEENINIGTAKIIIEGVDYYAGTIIKKFNIYPKKTKIKSVSLKPNKKGYITIKVKKRAGGARFQVQYSRKKNTGFVDLKKTAKTSFKTKKLLPGKTYYLRVRCYKIINGENYYSDYSAVKKVKIKKLKVVKKKKRSKKK